MELIWYGSWPNEAFGSIAHAPGLISIPSADSATRDRRVHWCRKLSGAKQAVISVVIPAKNEAVTLWFTIHAIRMEMDRDAGEPYEIIVVDNDSTDSTKAFLEDYSIAPWIRRIERTDRSGPDPVRNAGADAAQGDILVFADAHVLFSLTFTIRRKAGMGEMKSISI